MNKKTIIIALVVLAAVGAGVYFFMKSAPSNVVVENPPPPPAPAAPPPTPQPANNPPAKTAPAGATIIGTSAGGRDILAYHYGTGSKELFFVGGIHGGYEWNTVLVAWNLMDYLKAHPEAVPKNVSVMVIPVMNPDGLNKVVGTTGRFAAADVPSSQALQISGRFNANNVDLSRNFACDWQANGVWKTTPVSGGSAAFSEPESRAIRDYVKAKSPTAVVVWYSAAGGVYSSSCDGPIPAETAKINSVYARASGYPSYKSFDSYKLTGDMVNWLAKENIPGISILLTNHTDVEWDKNLAGIQALLKYYGK